MKFEIVDDIPVEKWEKYVLQHPKGNIFHSHHMFEVFKRTENYDPFLVFVLDKYTRKILALLSAVEVNIFNSFLSRLTARSIFFGGLLMDKNGKAGDALLKGLKVHDDNVNKRVLFTEIRNSERSSDYRSLLENNKYVYEDNLTYIIDLRKGEDNIFRSFSKDRRKNIRRGKKRGVVVKEVDHVRQVSIFYDIINNVYAMRKVPIADISLFENSFELLSDIPMFKIFLAQFAGEWIGGQAVLLFNNNILAWYGAAYQEWSALHPNEILIWQVIKWGIRHGFHTFDLGGAGKPGEQYGVRDFKARFGGQVLNYGRYTRMYHPLLYNTAKAAYATYRKFS